MAADLIIRKLIIDLQPSVFWCLVHLWTPFCLNMVFIIDKLWFAQKIGQVLTWNVVHPYRTPPGLTVFAHILKYPTQGLLGCQVLCTIIWCIGTDNSQNTNLKVQGANLL